MPWTAADARRHVQGLTPHQAQVWARVANGALRACLADGGSAAECDGRAIRQANAVAQRAPTKSIKAAADGRLNILAIPFGGPFAGGESGVDGDREYFSAKTDLALDWFPTQRPLLFHHGLDDAGPGIVPVGYVDTSTAKRGPEGWWVQAWLDRQNQYFKQIGEMLDEDALFASSGAMPHLVRRAKDGEILRWPWVELSLTPTPSNLLAMVSPAQAKAHYKSAGLTVPPTIDPDELLGYSEQLDRLLADVGDFTERSRELAEGRLKVGRALSEQRRKRLGELMARMREGASELEALLTETDPAPREAATAEGKSAAHAPGTPTQPTSAPEPAAAHAPELAAVYAQFAEHERFYTALGVLPPTTP
jgi:hypothetical protein